MRAWIIAGGLASLLLAGAAGAQERRDPAGEWAAALGTGMLAGHPAMILWLREPLGLSTEQVQSLERIERQAGELREQNMDATVRAAGEAEALLESETPDLARYEAKLREAADHDVRASLELARATAEARLVLTPEQRASLRFGMRMLRQILLEQSGMAGLGTELPEGSPDPRY